MRRSHRDPRSWRLSALAAVLAFFCSFLPATAQRLQTRTYTVDDGLPNASVLDIEQDTNGKLWILHRLGVSVFDGENYETHTTANGLPAGSFGALDIDNLGRVWLSHLEGDSQLSYLDETGWKSTPRSIGTGRELFSLAALVNEGKTRVATASLEGLWLWDGEKWHAWTAGNGPLDDYRVRHLVDWDNRIAVATMQGLCFIEDKTLDCSPRQRDPRLAQHISALDSAPVRGDGPDRLWLLTTDWVGYLDEDSDLQIVAEPGLPHVSALLPGSLAVHPSGDLYMGSLSTVRLLDPQNGLRTLGMAQGLVADGTHRIFVDREEQIWVASPRGMTRIAGRRFTSYGEEHGLLEDEVSAIVEPRPGRLIFGHNFGLTIVDNGQPQRTIRFPTSPESLPVQPRVLDMAAVPSGDVYIAASHLGLLRLRRDGTLESKPVLDEHMMSVEVDGDGRVWALHQLRLFKNVESGAVEVPVPASDAHMRWLIRDPRNGFLIGTFDGLLYQDGGDWRRAVGPTSASSNVYCALVQGEQTLLGTSSGLMQLEDGELVSATYAGQKVTQPIYFMFKDPQDRLWMGTDNGVLVFDDPSRGPRRLTVAQGLAGRETNRGGYLVDHQGKIWIGTQNGASVYDARNDRPRPTAPHVELTVVEAAGERLPLDQPQKLASHQKTLVFRFQTTYLAREEPVLFRYRLEGLETAWQGPEALPSGDLRYANLAPGTYRLQLRAGWEDGPWSEEIISAKLHIPRPLWLQPWLYLLAFTIIGGLIYLAHIFKTQALVARSTELEDMNLRLSQTLAERDQIIEDRRQISAERERLITELKTKNDELERFTFSVAHDLKGPLVTIRGFLGFVRAGIQNGETQSALEDLQRIEGAAHQMGNILEELLEISRIGRVDVQLAPVELRPLVEETAELLAGRIHGGGVDVVIAPDLPVVLAHRQHLQRVLQNLIENAVKFMGEQESPRIEIGVRSSELTKHVTNNACVVYVQDNGSGIDPQHHNKIFTLFERLQSDVEGTGLGLGMVKRIVERLGGRIWVESEGSGKGSTFCFTLQIAEQAPETD